MLRRLGIHPSTRASPFSNATRTVQPVAPGQVRILGNLVNDFDFSQAPHPPLVLRQPASASWSPRSSL